MVAASINIVSRVAAGACIAEGRAGAGISGALCVAWCWANGKFQRTKGGRWRNVVTAWAGCLRVAWRTGGGALGIARSAVFAERRISMPSDRRDDALAIGSLYAFIGACAFLSSPPAISL